MEIKPSGLLFAATLMIGMATLLPTAAGAAEARSTLPAFVKVKQAVYGYFAGLPDYQSGDIVARSQAEAVLERVRKLGWTVADREALVKRVSPDGDFLVQQLQSPSGRAFMQQIKSYPEAYDRLDRLARLPYGENTVEALVRGPDGYKMIEYMTTAPGGINLGKMLSEAPAGKAFNKPTGRIYTADQLVAALRVSYDAAKNAGGNGGKSR